MYWNNISDGYEFHVYFQHGDSSYLSVETIKCVLQNKEFEKYNSILSHLKYAVNKSREQCTENVAQYIESKTEFSENEIMQIIESIIKIDIKYENVNYMAQVHHIEIYRFENGKVQVSQI